MIIGLEWMDIILSAAIMNKQTVKDMNLRKCLIIYEIVSIFWPGLFIFVSESIIFIITFR